MFNLNFILKKGAIFTINFIKTSVLNLEKWK